MGSLIKGPFSSPKFLGASVRNITGSVGWNEQSTNYRLSLVEDRRLGDAFVPVPTGTPVTVSVGGWSYTGILQRWERKGELSGNPTYEADVTDPREVLDGARVVLNSFRLPVSSVPNMLNPYGYWESSLGFGGSMSNESGMIWDAPFELVSLTPDGGGVTVGTAARVGIKTALSAIFASPGDYGGPLVLKGVSYAVDLTGLPPAPPFYRVGGVAPSLMEVVSQLCQDAGCDYIVYLDGDADSGYVIRLKTVSRVAQPDTSAVAAGIAALKDVQSRSFGLELRNDYTNAFLIGGDFQNLEQVVNIDGGHTIWPYWGTDADGNVVVGQGDPGDWHEFYLDSTEVADVVGGTSYHCTLPELRTALADYESWAFWVMKYYPDKANAIGLVNTVDSESDLQELFPDVVFRRDLIAETDDALYHLGRMNEEDYWVERAQRVYEFVRRYASENYGRKWLVRLPFYLYWKMEPETLHVISSDEISDGGWLPENSSPLGIDYLDADRFQAEDGRFGCFVAFPFDPKMDLSKVQPENAAVGNGFLFVKATADDQIVYLPGDLYPYCVVTLNDAVYARAADPLGGVADIAKMVGTTADALAFAVNMRHGSWPVRIHPAPYRPTAAAVPMKSNRDSYGPWGTNSGVAGKVYFDRDESLVPWQYGDYGTLNAAATAKLAGIATKMQEAAVASAVVAGEPSVQLGDVLVTGGPNVTSIEVSVGTDGVTTAYRMQTYTPAFGAFQRSNADRLRRLGLASLQTRKVVRSLFRRGREGQQVRDRVRVGWMEYAAHAVRQQTPHDTVYASVVQTQAGLRTQASHLTIDEFAANVRADDPDAWKRTAGMSLEGLYRPFSTDFDPAYSGPIPHLEAADVVVQQQAPTTQSLEPFNGSDVDILVSGKTYPGHLHRLKGQLDYDHVRAVGLRGPLVIVGYGPELTGKPVPNSGDETKSVDQWADTFLPDVRLHPEKWRAGVLDVRWDNWRKVWTFPTVLKGTLDADLSGGPPVTMTIQVHGRALTQSDKVEVYLDLGGTVKAGTLVYATYYALENKWYVTQAPC